MDYKLKELRQKYERLKKSTEKPFKYNPERDWESENVQWSNYRDKLEKFSEAEKAFFEYLKEKKQAKKLLQTRSL